MSLPRLDSSSIATELAEGGAGAAPGRLSLDLGGGGAVRPSTLLDEYERLAIEAQLSRAVLRRSYSEPSPSRLAVAAPPRGEAQARRDGRRAESGDARSAPRPQPRPRRIWLLDALKQIFCWLGGAWGGGRGRRRKVEEQAAPAPRVQLLDYLR